MGQPAVTFILDPDATPIADFRITNHGTVWTFHPLTIRAEDWWNDNVENSPTIGGAFAVDQHMVEGVLSAISHAGLSA